jgi:hypothetical protein
MEIQDLLKTYEIKKVKRISERAELIKNIYAIYSSEKQKIFRKKENWKRYIAFLKENRKENTPENIKTFKKSKKFIKEHSVKTVCFFVSHIPTADLYYIFSMARDMQNRNENFSGYFISSILTRSK